jgi:hypothetical protein
MARSASKSGSEKRPAKGRALKAATPPPRTKVVTDIAVGALLFVLPYIVLQTTQMPVKVTLSLAVVMCCSALWIIMDAVPHFRRIAATTRVALTVVFLSVMSIAVAFALPHSDLFELRPNLSGVISAGGTMVVGGRSQWGYWLSLIIENSGGPTYVRRWKVFFVADNGKRVYGAIVPPPPVGKAITGYGKDSLGSTDEFSYTEKNAIVVQAFEKPIESDRPMNGVLVVRFPPASQPPSAGVIQVIVEDREKKDTTIGPIESAS